MNWRIYVAIILTVFFGWSQLVWYWEQRRRKALKLKVDALFNYTPRGDRVIVKRHALPAQKPDEVFIPSSQQKPPNEGTVIAVGPEVSDIFPGDHVCFVEYAGTAVEIDGEEYLSMREVEIHGKRG